MVFDFFVCGSRIVPLYERLPFGTNADNPYPAFTELIPINVTTQQGQWHDYAIRYDRGHDRVAWLVDDRIVADARAGRSPARRRGPVVKIDSMKIGGGLFTMYGDLRNDLRRRADRAGNRGSRSALRADAVRPGRSVEFRPFEITRQ